MLQSMGSQRVGHDWVTELNRCHLDIFFIYLDSGRLILQLSSQLNS